MVPEGQYSAIVYGDKQNTVGRTVYWTHLHTHKKRVKAERFKKKTWKNASTLNALI